MRILNAIADPAGRSRTADSALRMESPIHASTRESRAEIHTRQEAFAAVLGRSLSPTAEAALTPKARARQAAEQLVTQTFILPLLKQLRESDRTAAPFAPSQAEKQFRALGDAELAQRIVHAARFPLVDRLARDLLKRSGKDGADRSASDALNEARASIPRPTPGVPLGADPNPR